MPVVRVVAALLLLLPSAVRAHEGGPPAPHDIARAWPLEPGVTIPLLLTLGLYLVGVRRLRARAGPHAFRGRVPLFAAGWLVLAIALASPLHPLGGALFSAHMLQHELVMAVAAPLLVLGQPVAPILFALPPTWRRRAGSWAVGRRSRPVVEFLGRPVMATLLHAAAVLVWHLPALYASTLESAGLHAAQHASFLGSALIFWWALLHAGARRRRGTAVIALFVTTVYTGGLGALLTISETPWYAAYGTAAAAWGLTPLEDQQLAGIIMWMPGAGPYLLAALLLAAGWIRDAGWAHRQRRQVAGLGCIVFLLIAGCRSDGAERRDASRRLTGGDAERGRVAIRYHGCGSCHTIRGVPGANGLVGPVLDGLASRTFIAGVLPNSGENLVRWIMHPRAIAPKTAMPDLGVPGGDARDIAAYLYTLSR